MIIDVITIFPEMFTHVVGSSIIKRARRSRVVTVGVHDLRRFSHDKHRKVDDRPYGGGPGMVMQAEPFFEAVASVRRRRQAAKSRIVLLSPQGRPLTQAIAQRLAKQAHLILLCGHYEGIDERVRRALVDEELSIGDYVLTGGELPAMVVIDAVVRLLPGALGDVESTASESFADGLLEYPHYTRPRVYRKMAVPKILLTGHHAAIAAWRQRQAQARTRRRRPDLLVRSPKS
ncbi:MAG: tRNA (guanosine(37)-N1)-methyltransferase TrmD [Candidatus Omnitrophica bacterium]|nr:tRNA (guanosine(37)-N1)-methyltransferase TrmD [Candidatus Omnitrophota bacterium]